MIQKRYAALDGGRHTHLILLHEQLYEVGFHIRVEQLVEAGRRTSFPSSPWRWRRVYRRSPRASEVSNSFCSSPVKAE